MSEQLDLEKVKLKTYEQLSENERAFVVENKDSLNSEDLEAYAPLFTKNEEVVETPSEEAGAQGENTEGQGEGGEEDPNAKPATEEKPVNEGYAFKSEEEAREFVQKQLIESEKAKQAAIAAASTQEEKERIDKEWKPSDWLHAKKVLGSELKEEIKADLKKEAEERRQQEIGQQLQKEWEALAKEKGLPSDKTEKGKAIHDSIVNFGVAAKKTTFKEAYEVWSKVPEQFGGGLKAAAEAEAKQEDKKQVSEQKKAAAKIGGQNSGAGTKPVKTAGTVEYNKLHKAKSTMDLLKQEGYI